MGYIGMCGPKRWSFSAVLVINRVSILPIVGLNRVWFYHSNLKLSIFLGRGYFFIIINMTVDKNPSQIMFRVTVPAAGYRMFGQS